MVKINTKEILEKIEEIEKYEREIEKLKFMIIVVFISLIMGMPINLILLPAHYSNNTLLYGNEKIFIVDNLKSYIGALIIITVAVIWVVMELYKRYIIKIPSRTFCEISFKGDYRKVFNKIKKFLKENDSLYGMVADVNKENTITCLSKKDETELISFEILPDRKKVKINIFDIESKRVKLLLRAFLDEFQ